MSVKFKPMSEKEVSEVNLWKKGNYAFEVLEAEQGVSKSGNDQFKLKVKIFSEDGTKSQFIYDYLTFTDNVLYKIRHFCDAVGLLASYEAGELSEHDFVGKTGYAKVGISVDKTGNYPDKNGINDYVTDGTITTKTTLEKATNNDSVPF